MLKHGALKVSMTLPTPIISPKPRTKSDPGFDSEFPD